MRARGPGVSRWLYAWTRGLLAPLMRGWFRLQVSGPEHVPEEGAAILAPNHKSFWDPFFVGMGLRRSVRFMAKIELFRGPLGSLLARLGAFPVRRGTPDEESMRTARALLEGGELVVVFPEGTRVDDPDALAKPRRGAGRLALDSGAPIVPVAIEGTADLWLGPFPKPRVVRVAFLPPVAPASDGDSPAVLIDEHVWPAVAEEYGRLRALPGVVAASLAGIGIGALVARKRRLARRPQLLGRTELRRLRQRRARRGWFRR